MSRDPITERGGKNLYEFIGNNGVNRGDYLGMIVIVDDLAIAYAAAAAGLTVAAYLATPAGQQLLRDLAQAASDAAAAAAETARCAAKKAACIAGCIPCLPSRDFSGDKFYKCVADCMSGSGCYGN